MEFQVSMDKLADTLKMKIVYNNGEVTGVSNFNYLPLPGLQVPVTMTAQRIFANDAVGLLAHVIGDLYILVSHLAKTGSVSVFLIDGSRLSEVGSAPGSWAMQLVGKSMTIKQVVGNLRSAVVQSFLYKDRKWSTLKLPT